MDNYHGMKYPKGAIFLGSNPALALIIKCKCLLGHHGILRHNQEFQRELRRIYQEFVTFNLNRHEPRIRGEKKLIAKLLEVFQCSNSEKVRFACKSWHYCYDNSVVH